MSADAEICRLAPSYTQTLHKKFWCVDIVPILLVQGSPLSSEVAGGVLSAWELSSLCRWCGQAFELAGKGAQRSSHVISKGQGKSCSSVASA